LWSIAAQRVGGADRIQDLVAVLWAHNRERIGTGDPDVLPVGTTIDVPLIEGRDDA
jgi:hypothetical protein